MKEIKVKNTDGVCDQRGGNNDVDLLYIHTRKLLRNIERTSNNGQSLCTMIGLQNTT